MVGLMKSSFYGNHDNHSTTKCFFGISCTKYVVKSYPISNASWVHNFQLQNRNRSIFVNLENIILWGWAWQILGRDKCKNRDKAGKMLRFPGLWRGIFTVCPWMVRTPPFYHSDPKCLVWFHNWAGKLQKPMFFNQFLNIPWNLSLSHTLFLG